MPDAADQVFTFVFDGVTRIPCSMAWQPRYGGDLPVYRFFRVVDCQTTAPANPVLIGTTAKHWHQLGLQLARRKGGPNAVSR